MHGLRRSLGLFRISAKHCPLRVGNGNLIGLAQRRTNDARREPRLPLRLENGRRLGAILGVSLTDGFSCRLSSCVALTRSILQRDVARSVSTLIPHEAMYRSLYIQARGALKKELLEHLRRSRVMRRSRQYTMKTEGHAPTSRTPSRSVNVLPRPKIVRYQGTGRATCYSATLTAKSQRWLNARAGS